MKGEGEDEWMSSGVDKPMKELVDQWRQGMRGDELKCKGRGAGMCTVRAI